MATGDAALRAGMDLVSGNTAARDIDDEINKTRDYIADAGTSAATPNTVMRRNAEGFTAAPNPVSPSHIANKGYVDGAGTSVATPNTIVRRNADGVFAIAEPQSASHPATRRYVDERVGDADAVRDTANAAQANANAARNGELLASVYGRTLGGQYRSLYVNGDGVLGWVASSRSKKKNIKRADVDVDAVLNIEVVQFVYRVAIDPAGHVQHGVIAEQLDELGLSWLVDYGDGGEPEGVRYDLFALALIPVAQAQAARLAELEARLDRLEGGAR